MNLHIVPDNVFINKFCENLHESEVAGNNKIVVRTNNKRLNYIHHNLPFGQVYSRKFDAFTGPINAYKRVYIHQFTPLLYRWVSSHHFNELNWMVWGADLYNIPSVATRLYENLTWRQYVRHKWSLKDFFYRTKVSLLHDRFRNKSYGKVSKVLTWMTSEYEFACRHIPGLRAGLEFFFYENDLPYQALEEVLNQPPRHGRNSQPVYILGNSSTPELNHLDVVAWMQAEGVKADLYIPVSYGDAHYASFLKKNLSFYKGGELRFMDQYMDFKEYLQFLYQADGLIMNNIRPQGYGNIFMMMYLGKKIFLNEKNLSIPELHKAGLVFQPLQEMKSENKVNWLQNKPGVTHLLSHQKLVKIYRELFS